MNTAQALFVVVVVLLVGAGVAAGSPSERVGEAAATFLAYVFAGLVLGILGWALVSAYVALG